MIFPGIKVHYKVYDIKGPIQSFQFLLNLLDSWFMKIASKNQGFGSMRAR